MKTEKEKMLNGELYYGGDPELLKDRVNARRLARLFNNVVVGGNPARIIKTIEQ